MCVQELVAFNTADPFYRRALLKPFVFGFSGGRRIKGSATPDYVQYATKHADINLQREDVPTANGWAGRISRADSTTV